MILKNFEHKIHKIFKKINFLAGLAFIWGVVLFLQFLTSKTFTIVEIFIGIFIFLLLLIVFLLNKIYIQNKVDDLYKEYLILQKEKNFLSLSRAVSSLDEIIKIYDFQEEFSSIKNNNILKQKRKQITEEREKLIEKINSIPKNTTEKIYEIVHKINLKDNYLEHKLGIDKMYLEYYDFMIKKGKNFYETLLLFLIMIFSFLIGGGLIFFVFLKFGAENFFIKIGIICSFIGFFMIFFGEDTKRKYFISKNYGYLLYEYSVLKENFEYFYQTFLKSNEHINEFSLIFADLVQLFSQNIISRKEVLGIYKKNYKNFDFFMEHHKKEFENFFEEENKKILQDIADIYENISKWAKMEIFILNKISQNEKNSEISILENKRRQLLMKNFTNIS